MAEALKMTATAEGGEEYLRCMRACLDNVGLQVTEIDHVNAHGTSTPVNDRSEALAIGQLFGTNLDNITITANKSNFGHSLGASSVVEAALSIMVLQQAKIPPVLNLDKPLESQFSLPFTRTEEERVVKRILSNSFGFGGENASIVLEAVT